MQVCSSYGSYGYLYFPHTIYLVQASFIGVHVSREHDRICPNRNATSGFFSSTRQGQTRFLFKVFFFKLSFVRIRSNSSPLLPHFSCVHLNICCGICLL